MIKQSHATLDNANVSVTEATSFLLIGWLAAILMLSGIGLWLGVSISPAHLWLGLLLTLAGALVVGVRAKTLILATFVCAFIVLPAAYCAGRLYDLSYDGQVYHMTAVIALSRGWNPLQYLTLAEWDPVFAEAAGADIFIEHYAKGAWFIEAAIYKATGNIELGKSINLVLIVSAFLIGWSVLRRLGVQQKWAVALALVVALNPVAIYQAATFYVDGQLASLFTICVLLSIGYLHQPRIKVLAQLLCAFLLLIEVKFTGLVYAVLMVIGLALGAWLLGKRSAAIRYAVALFCLGIFAVGVIGYQPYITNTINNGHPFYPAVGLEDGKNIQSGQAPREFIEMNRVAKLVVSTLSMSSNSDLEWKFPMTIRSSELLSMTGPDTRYAGLGPLYSGALLLSLLLTLLVILDLPKSVLRVFAFMLALLVITVLINPEAWWARLSPQLWLLPIIPIVATVRSNLRARNWLAGMTVVLMLVNTSLVSIYNIRYSIAHSVAFGKMLASLSVASRTMPIDIMLANGFKVTTNIRLIKSGVRFRQVQTLECKPSHPFAHIFKTCAL